MRTDPGVYAGWPESLRSGAGDPEAVGAGFGRVAIVHAGAGRPRRVAVDVADGDGSMVFPPVKGMALIAAVRGRLAQEDLVGPVDAWIAQVYLGGCG